MKNSMIFLLDFLTIINDYKRRLRKKGNYLILTSGKESAPWPHKTSGHLFRRSVYTYNSVAKVTLFSTYKEAKDPGPSLLPVIWGWEGDPLKDPLQKCNQCKVNFCFEAILICFTAITFSLLIQSVISFFRPIWTILRRYIYLIQCDVFWVYTSNISDNYIWMTVKMTVNTRIIDKKPHGVRCMSHRGLFIGSD